MTRVVPGLLGPLPRLPLTPTAERRADVVVVGSGEAGGTGAGIVVGAAGTASGATSGVGAVPSMWTGTGSAVDGTAAAGTVVVGIGGAASGPGPARALAVQVVTRVARPHATTSATAIACPLI